MNPKKIISSITVGAGAVAIGFGLQFALASWTAAPNPPTSGNTDAPINIGAGSQTKTGLLGLANLVVTNMNVASGTVSTAGSILANDGQGDASWVSASTLGLTSIPSGAIAAFSTSTCPTGWSAYTLANGRTIIGAGAASGLTTRTVGATGGAESETLTVSQLPAISFRTQVSTYYEGGNNFTSGHGYPTFVPINEYFTSDPVGGGQAHKTMQPYITELYCQKN